MNWKKTLTKERQTSIKFMVTYFLASAAVFIWLYYYVGYVATILYFAANFVIGSAAAGTMKNGTYTLLNIIDDLQNIVFHVKAGALKHKKLLASLISYGIILTLGYIVNESVINNELFKQITLFQSITISTGELSSFIDNLLDTITFTLFSYVLVYSSFNILKLQKKIKLREMIETLQLLKANNIELQVSHDSEGRLRYNFTAILDNLYSAKHITNTIKWNAYKNIRDNFVEFKSLEVLPYSIKWSDRLLLSLESTHEPV